MCLLFCAEVVCFTWSMFVLPNKQILYETQYTQYITTSDNSEVVNFVTLQWNITQISNFHQNL